PCACAHGTDVVASFFFFTLLSRCSIAPVYSRHVITISTVFSSQLPVTFIGISRRTTQNFQTLLRLIHDHVNDFGRFTQVFFQRRNIRIQAAEQRSEEHTSELQSRENLVCRLL